MSIKFESDYQEGCHPKILARLSETNYEQTSGYAVDKHCEHAKELIKNFIGKPDAEVFFLIGGTQANAAVIKHLLRPYEGVICVHSGHINVHEAGAVEAAGHKIIPLDGENGLLQPEHVEKILNNFYADEASEHMVQPGMIYISYPSEFGTLYKKSELEKFKSICEKFDLKLFIDGARLGTALTSSECDLTIKELANLCDVFYIGGTKNGALFGEAVIFPEPANVNTKHFRTLVKQQCGLLSKGRLLGIQFEVLFEDNLYFDLAKHANEQAAKIKNAFKDAGVEFFVNSSTNQQFPILTHEQIKKLRSEFDFLDGGEKIAVRFCTSWATTDENVQKLVNAIKYL